MNSLKQLIPSKFCLKCRVCCRFPKSESGMFPLFRKEEVDRLSQEQKSFLTPSTQAEGSFRPVAKPYPGPNGKSCACAYFNPSTQECAIYPNRPMDCQLYPFVLTLSPTRKRVFLGLDTQCPFVQDLAHQEDLIGYGEYVRGFLEEKEMIETVGKSPGLAGKEEQTILPCFPLAGLTEKIFHETLFGNPPPPSSGFLLLTLKDRESIEESLSGSPRAFAEEAFVFLFVFSDLLRFYWKKEKEALFIIAEQGNQFFMPIPPISKERTPEVLKQGFDLLNQLNPDGIPSRIEGLTQQDLPLVEKARCTFYPKPPEYRYWQKELAELKGDAFKSKRALCNAFAKHYDFTYAPYQPKDLLGCLHLFKAWQERKLSKTTDPYEQALLEDATFVHRKTLLHAKALNVEGRVVKIGGEIKGYTFGYALDEETWCILLEIADPQIKGLAQYIFREFCREKDAFRLISALDDSGLERLRQVKESYRPFLKKIPYAAVRKREGNRWNGVSDGWSRAGSELPQVL